LPIDTINANVINVKDLNGFSLINRSSSSFVSDINNSMDITAGSLSTVLTSADLATISNLKLTGTIDARDFVTLRDKMPKLTTLDLSGTSISTYTGTDGTAGTNNYLYPANEIPQYAFSKFQNAGLFRQLSSIKLPSTATSIGGSAFSGCINLKSILIPSSITSIKEFAFLGIGGLINVEAANSYYTSVDGILFNKPKTKLIQCSPLVAVGKYNIPTTVTTIGSAAFGSCVALTSVNIPLSVTLIEDLAFEGCEHLQTVFIPSSVDSIGKASLDIFGSITVDTLNSKYSSLNGVLYSRNKSILLQCPTSKKAVFNIPSTVKSIGNYAFGNCNLINSISIPASVSSIKTYAFANCSGLTSIQVYPATPPILNPTDSAFVGVNKIACNLYVPVGSKSLYQNAPLWKDFKNIIEGEIPTSKTINLTTPGTLSSFLTTTELNYISNLTITGTIDARDFKSMRDDMSVLADLNLSATTISAYSGTAGTYSADNINYPANVTPGRAFYYPYSISNGDGTIFLSHGKLTLNSVNLPESIVGIGMSTFANCSNLKSVIIHSAVTSIEQSAFYSCNGLISVDVPVSVKSIGNYAFNECTGLKSINIPIALSTIGDHTFYNCKSLKSITLSEGLTSIGNDAFNGCNSLNSVAIPSTVTSMGDYAFADCSSWTGPLNISSNVTYLGEGAFNGCYSLGSLIIGPKVKVIQDDTFTGCSSLTSVTIPSTVSSIGAGAFGLCTGLTQVDIGEGVDSIGEKAFWICTRLGSVTIPSSVTSIGNGSFMLCSSLKSATISNGVLKIGALAFANTSMFNVAFSGLADLPGSYIAPTGNSELMTIKIPATVTTIGNSAFLGCTDSLVVDAANPNYSSVNGVLFNKNKTVLMQFPISKKGIYTLPESVNKIQALAFSNCKELTSINIPENVDSIGAASFYGCHTLKSICVKNRIPVNLNTTDSVFNFVDKINCTLYVPTGYSSVYQSANQWKDFKNILEMPTALPTIGNDNFRLYLNPIDNTIHVNGIDGVCTLKLFDINGRLLLDKQVVINEPLSVNTLPKGMYIVKIITAEGIAERKIILK